MEIPRRVRYRCPTVRSAVPSCIVALVVAALRPLVALAILSAPAASAAADTVPAALTREFQAGVDAYRLGKYDDARAHLEKAQAIDPRLPGPHRFLAAVAQAQHRWADCIAEARRALQLNPRSQEIGDTRKLHDGCRESDGRPAYRGELGDAAAIAVTANVPGATVKIGGLRYGGTPVPPRLIKPGVLHVDVEKSGWKPARVTIDALPAIVTDIAVELEPVAPATPPGAAR
jgi:hypothetical protein